MQTDELVSVHHKTLARMRRSVRKAQNIYAQGQTEEAFFVLLGAVNPLLLSFVNHEARQGRPAHNLEMAE